MRFAECAKHGADFIEFKCRFCCNIASWYCWGTTHFCEARARAGAACCGGGECARAQTCHDKQMKGQAISKKTAAELGKCTGGARCELHVVRHPAAPAEFSLGEGRRALALECPRTPWCDCAGCGLCRGHAAF